ncbi:MAG: pyridoxamine 5'-phosphate oxidase, partial [Acidimicrobiia bacterium]
MRAQLELVRRLAAADKGLAVVSTTRPDGTVHSSLVNAGVFDHPLTKEPTVAFVARGDTYKLRVLTTA